MNTDDLYAQIERLLFENQQLRQERAAAFRQADEYMAERDRARATAVALEQRLSAIEYEIRSLADKYERAYLDDIREGTEAASLAVDDCLDSIELIGDVVLGDTAEDAAKEATDA